MPKPVETDKREDPRFPRKEPKAPSIWDKDVDPDKLKDLTPEERGHLFPNDYNKAGEPYGDF
jgi:hypothetical protein